MNSTDRKEIIENIEYLIKKQNKVPVRNIIIDTHPADLADILQELDDDARDFVFSLLDAETASEVVTELDEVTREDIFSELEPERLSEIVDEMDSDDATDVVMELPEHIAEQVLSSIEPQDRAEVEKLLDYDEDSAGGIMALEFIAVYDDQTVDDAIREIRRRAEEVDDIFNVYAIDRGGRLAGIVPIKSLIIRNPKRLINDIMEKEVISVGVDTDQEDVAKIVRKYDLAAIAVVDNHNRLVGRITIDDVIDVLHEEANEDIQRMAGITDEEILQESSTLRISRNRIPWLLISFLGELGSAMVLDHFHATMTQILISAFFIPVIMATGGNAGIQSSTIVVRSLSLMEGGTSGLWQRVFRELRVAILNGFIIGSLLFAVITFWKHDPLFGIVGGVAIFLVMINSAAFGAIVPFALNKLKIDPAIATGPFITTANDIFGLLIYLGTATIYLHFYA
jgi:magnesium transporter